MKKIYGFCLVSVLIAILVAGLFLLGIFGIELSLLTQLFILFFGVVIGFQCAPAALKFTDMLRGLCTDEETVVEQITRRNT